MLKPNQHILQQYIWQKTAIPFILQAKALGVGVLSAGADDFNISASMLANNLPTKAAALAKLTGFAEQVRLSELDWHLPVQAIEEDTEADADVLLAEPETARPPMYAVVIFNDDYTPMEFVVHVLMKYFKLDAERATEVMLQVHYKGKGVAGVYPRDIAETKAQQVNKEARLEGHPLLCQIEPQA